MDSNETISATAVSRVGTENQGIIAWRWIGPLVPGFVVASLTLVFVLRFAPTYGALAGSLSIPQIMAKWTPLLAKGFFFDVLVVTLSMFIGTVLGFFLGALNFSPIRPIRRTVWLITQFLRNIPGLVFLFFIAFVLPFTINVGGFSIPFPGWAKAVASFSIKIMANVAEVVRGAIGSVPVAQWEAAESLAFSRKQVFWRVILPQCITRMIPPWMNVYAIFFMAVPIASIIGVEDAITNANLALKAELSPTLIIPIYLYILSWFFVVAYAMQRWTHVLEKKYDFRG
jgi:polar amino acid transport system permease protein